MRRRLRDRLGVWLHALLRYRYTMVRNDPLTALANRYGSDKGNLHMCRHHYTRVYDALFRPWRDRALVLLEIGLPWTEDDRGDSAAAVEGGSRARAVRVPSLEMWRAYFPKARLYGFDIDDFSGIRIRGCTTIQGDMANRGDLERLVGEIGQPMDIIVDDGSHASHHQQIALGFLFRHVAPGGYYIIEDLHWQDPVLERPDGSKTRDVLRTLLASGRLASPFMFDEERSFIEAHLEELSLYDTAEVAGPRAIDALAILRRPGQ